MKLAFSRIISTVIHLLAYIVSTFVEKWLNSHITEISMSDSLLSSGVNAAHSTKVGSAKNRSKFRLLVTPDRIVISKRSNESEHQSEGEILAKGG